MNEKNLMSDDGDLKTWRGYVAGLLENIREDIRNTSKKVEDLGDDFNKLSEDMAKHSNCGVEQLKMVVYGDGKNGNGMINKITRLSTEFKIKSGVWGVMGGMIPILIVLVIEAIRLWSGVGR